MRHFPAMIVGLLMAGMATSAYAQRGDEGAAAFVRSVYAAYSDEDISPPDLCDRAVWSRRMATLIRRDRELATEDLPYLDADPICDCQDWENLRVQSVVVSLDTARMRWIATVRFVNSGETKTARLLLWGDPIRGWTIDDVLNPGYPSLADQLTESIQRVEAGGSAHE